MMPKAKVVQSLLTLMEGKSGTLLPFEFPLLCGFYVISTQAPLSHGCNLDVFGTRMARVLVKDLK